MSLTTDFITTMREREEQGFTDHSYQRGLYDGRACYDEACWSDRDVYDAVATAHCLGEFYPLGIVSNDLWSTWHEK